MKPTSRPVVGAPRSDDREAPCKTQRAVARPVPPPPKASSNSSSCLRTSRSRSAETLLANVRPEPTDKPHRKPLSLSMPRRDQTLDPGNAFNVCGGRLKHASEMSSRAGVSAREVGCEPHHPAPHSLRLLQGLPAGVVPLSAIERGWPGPDLLAHILVSMYAEHPNIYTARINAALIALAKSWS